MKISGTPLTQNCKSATELQPLHVTAFFAGDDYSTFANTRATRDAGFEIGVAMLAQFAFLVKRNSNAQTAVEAKNVLDGAMHERRVFTSSLCCNSQKLEHIRVAFSHLPLLRHN